jgi:hypothetical protein
MNISYQFLKIGFFLAQDGLEPVLKQMAGSAIATVEGDGLSRQQTPHDG